MSALEANQRSAAQALGKLINAIGRDDFAASAAASLTAVTHFEYATFFLHGNGRPSEILFSDFTGSQAEIGIINYASHTFRFNPMLARKAGVFRARDFSRANVIAYTGMRGYAIRDPREELGFRTIGWPERLEEIGLYERVNAGVLELSFYRAKCGRGAADKTVQFLHDMRAPISAAFDRHISLVAERKMLGRPFDGLLSPREEEIASLILLGCSSEAIARRLGIARYTVKDHRKNMFRKLGISSMAELFILHREKRLRESAG